MTNKEILEIFKEKYPETNISDYRPLSARFVKDMQGVTIWTEKGDIIFFFPGKIGETKDGHEAIK